MKISLTSGGGKPKDLLSVSGVRLTQRLFEHDILEASLPLKSLESGQILVGKPESFLNQPLAYSLGDSGKWKGTVVSVSSSVDGSLGSHARLIASAPTQLLENGAHYRSFEEDVDLDSIIKDVLKPYPQNGIKRSGECDTHKLPFSVQYGESDFEFLLRICQQHGEWIYWTGEKLHIGKHVAEPIDLTVGRELLNVESFVRIHPLGFNLVKRDYLEDQSLTSGSDDLKISNKGFEGTALDLSKTMLYGKSVKMPRVSAKDKTHLDKLATSRMLAESKNLVGLSGVSKDRRLLLGTRFKLHPPKGKASGSDQNPSFGEYIVIRVVHEESGKDVYQNYFEAIPADTPVPPLDPNRKRVRANMETAVVTDNNDAKNLGRIKVRFLWQKENQSTPWIRMAAPYAGSDRGSFFVPEIKDEVLVGFDAGNPERPVVLGSLHHGKAKADHWQDDDNLKKGFRTKSGNEILFWDEAGKERIQILGKGKDGSTSPGFELTLSLEQNGKVTIKSNQLEIDGGQKVSINGDQLELEARGNVSIKGKTIKLN